MGIVAAMGRLTACPQCGSEEPGFFCRFCGTKLASPDADSVPGAAAAGEPGAGAAGEPGAGAGVASGVGVDGADGVAGPYTQPLGLPPQPAGAAQPAGATDAGADDLPPTEATAAYQPDDGAFGAQLAAAGAAYEPVAGPGQEAYAPSDEPYQPAYQQQPWYPPDDGTGYAALYSGGYPAAGEPYPQAEPAYAPQQPGASSKVLYGILGVLAACFVALGVWWATGRGDRPNEAVVAPTNPPVTTSAATPSTAATSSTRTTQASPSRTSASNPPPSSGGSATQGTATASPSPSGPAAEQARASLAALQAARDGSRQQVTLDGHWAAQLASKYDGIVDPLQTTASGSHTFAYPDILTEYQQLRAAHGDSVIVLHGTDFGRQVQRSKPVFVTLYDGGFSSSAQAQAWCARAFPGVTGKALANKCVPRSLRTPYR